MGKSTEDHELINILAALLFIFTMVSLAMLAVQLKVLDVRDEDSESNKPGHGDDGKGEGKGKGAGDATSGMAGGIGEAGESETADKLGFGGSAGGGGGATIMKNTTTTKPRLEKPQSSPTDKGHISSGEAQSSAIRSEVGSGGGGVGAGMDKPSGGSGKPGAPKIVIPEKMKWLVLFLIILAIGAAMGYMVHANMKERRAALKKSQGAKGKKKKPVLADAEAKELAEEFTEFIEMTYDSLAKMEDVRKAIAICYVRMAKAIAVNGIVRRPDLTPREFLVTVNRTFHVRSKGMKEMTVLFEEAVFSEHPMDEKHRDRALHVLRGLVEEVRGWR